jgi:N-acetylmuramoyl-L-alanine amidase
VGIVAGHSGFDSGAVCPDGLTEASINMVVSELVVARLAAEGIIADLLEEFDPRLDGYVASALVSVHADSCIFPEATGFKVASLEGSINPRSRLLVDCMAREYEARTGLRFHADSITYDMTQYHVFNTTAPQTPGAIIEVGFMLADRDLLTNHPDRVAQGIVDGVHCFLQGLRELE